MCRNADETIRHVLTVSAKQSGKWADKVMVLCLPPNTGTWGKLRVNIAFKALNQIHNQRLSWSKTTLQKPEITKAKLPTSKTQLSPVRCNANYFTKSGPWISEVHHIHRCNQNCRYSNGFYWWTKLYNRNSKGHQQGRIREEWQWDWLLL